MGNIQDKAIDTKQALAKTKPTKTFTKTLLNPSNKIKPLIANISKLRCLNPADLTHIPKNKPKMISKIQITRLDCGKIESRGFKILCKSLKDSKNLSSLIIDSGDHNTKELSRLLNLTNRWKKLKFHLNQADPSLRRCKELHCLDISFEEPENYKIKENIMKCLSQETRGLPKLKNFTLRFNLPEEVLMIDDTNYVPTFIFKYPRSLSSLNLKLNSWNSFSHQLFLNLQHLDQLEHLTLDSDIISSNIEPQLWKVFFEKAQKLKSLSLPKCFENNDQQSEASLAFLQVFNQLKNLTSLDIHFFYFSTTRQAQTFNRTLSNHLASFPHLKSLTFSFSTSISMNDHQSADSLDLFPSIDNLIQLEELQFNFFCYTTNVFLEYLAQSLRNLHNLKSLKLSISNPEIPQKTRFLLAESLQKLTHLERLDLNFPNADFGYVSMEVLAKSIADLPLTSLHLNLGRSKPAKTIFQKIGSLWEDAQRLTHFYSALYGFSSLSILSLDLSIFEISIPECKHLAIALRELNQLTSLSLTLPEFDPSNNFETLQYFLSSFIQMPRLTSLFLEFKGTGLGRKEIHHLASNLESCQSLENLELRFLYGSNFNREVFHCLLSGIANLSSLKNLKFAIEGTPMFDRVNAHRLILQNLTTLQNLETLTLKSLFRQYPRYPSQGIIRDLKKNLVNHPNWKHLVKLEIGNSQHL